MRKGYYIRTYGDENISKAIQERLFKHGYSWGAEGKKVWLQDKTHLYINNFNDNHITTDNGEFVNSGAHSLHHLKLNQFFGCDDWCRNKAKEMTVEEISKELGYEVKVVK